MENLERQENIKKAAEKTNRDGALEDAQLNDPRFASGESAQAYSGTWVGNVMEADGRQINGPTIG